MRDILRLVFDVDIVPGGDQIIAERPRVQVGERGSAHELFVPVLHPNAIK